MKSINRDPCSCKKERGGITYSAVMRRVASKSCVSEFIYCANKLQMRETRRSEPSLNPFFYRKPVVRLCGQRLSQRKRVIYFLKHAVVRRIYLNSCIVMLFSQDITELSFLPTRSSVHRENNRNK